jgi:hypothetical protein
MASSRSCLTFKTITSCLPFWESQKFGYPALTVGAVQLLEHLPHALSAAFLEHILD